MYRSWIFGRRAFAEALGVVLLKITPVADLEAQLAVVCPLGGYTVELWEVALFAILAYLAFPLRSIRGR